MTTQPEYMAWRCQWQSPEQAAKAAWEENLRLQKRVNDLETLIREALNALDDQDDKPVWINKTTTMRESFYWSLQPTPESRGERPLLEIPA